MKGFLNNFFIQLKTIESIQIHPVKESIEVLCLGLKVVSIKLQKSNLSMELDININHNSNPTDRKKSVQVFFDGKNFIFEGNFIQKDFIFNHIFTECNRILEMRGQYRNHEKWLHSLIIQKMKNSREGDHFIDIKFLCTEIPLRASEVPKWKKQTRDANYRIDILGFDLKTESLVIVEVKRGEELTSKKEFKKLQEQCDTYYDWVKKHTPLLKNELDNLTENININEKIEPFVYIIISKPPLTLHNLVGKYSEGQLKQKAFLFKEAFKEFLNSLNDVNIKKIYLINYDWRTEGITEIEDILMHDISKQNFLLVPKDNKSEDIKPNFYIDDGFTQLKAGSTQSINWHKEDILQIMNNLPPRHSRLMKVLAESGGSETQGTILRKLGDLAGKGTASSLQKIKGYINRKSPTGKILIDGVGTGEQRVHKINPQIKDWIIEWAKS